MTDITELAQSLKRRATSAKEFGESLYVKVDDVLTLVEALEKAQQRIEELREWNAGLAQESFERQQRISELLEGKVGNALLERENHHVEVVGKLLDRISELESRTVKLPKFKMLEDYLAEVAIEERKQILVGVKLEFHRACAAAGIKVEAE